MPSLQGLYLPQKSAMTGKPSSGPAFPMGSYGKTTGAGGSVSGSTSGTIGSNEPKQKPQGGGSPISIGDTGMVGGGVGPEAGNEGVEGPEAGNDPGLGGFVAATALSMALGPVPAVIGLMSALAVSAITGNPPSSMLGSLLGGLFGGGHQASGMEGGNAAAQGFTGGDTHGGWGVGPSLGSSAPNAGAPDAVGAAAGAEAGGSAEAGQGESAGNPGLGVAAEGIGPASASTEGMGTGTGMDGGGGGGK
jgi:hypothetical protein